MWVYVIRRFRHLLGELEITPLQRVDGSIKHMGVRSVLNAHYYGDSSGTANSRLVGSWGKGTEIRPPRDVDVLFELPWSVYTRFEQRPPGSNRQSELLQEVRRILMASYPDTRMRADGQVVIVPFVSYAVELLPAFRFADGQFWICDTNDGGSYKTTDPDAEARALAHSDTMTGGETIALIKMLKRWQEVCNVPLKSFQLELLATDFISSWYFRGRGLFWYDWMVRDFFGYLLGRRGGWVMVPGTFEIMQLGEAWFSRAESAYSRALRACEYESADQDLDAGWEWHQIFGDFVPLYAG